MWDIAVSPPALAKEAVNPELATETVNVDELSKVIVGSYDNDTKITNFTSSEIPLGCGGTENHSTISPSFINSVPLLIAFWQIIKQFNYELE